MRSLIGTLLLAGFLAREVGANDTFRVVVNTENPVRTLTREQVVAIFLKRAVRWGDGTAVTPVDQVDSSTTRAAFSREVIGKAVPDIVSYWQRQIFSGRDVPPLHKPSDAAVIEFVKATPGGIGYVSADADLTDVAVVTITK